MTRNFRVVALAGLIGFAVLALAWWFGTRCSMQALPNGYRGQICYSWFQPHMLIVSDTTGDPFFFAVLRGPIREHAPPSRGYVDLFGSGRISAFTTSHLDPAGQAWTETVELASKDDGRVDVVLEYGPVQHPLAGSLVRATKIRRDACKSWSSATEHVGDRQFAKFTCADRTAEEALALDQVEAAVATLGIADRRLGFVFWQGDQQRQPVSYPRTP